MSSLHSHIFWEFHSICWNILRRHDKYYFRSFLQVFFGVFLQSLKKVVKNSLPPHDCIIKCVAAAVWSFKTGPEIHGFAMNKILPFLWLEFEYFHLLILPSSTRIKIHTAKYDFGHFIKIGFFLPKNWHLSPVCEIKLTLVKSKKNLRPFDRFDRFSSSQFTFVSKFCFEWSQTGEETLSTNSENRGHKAICSICRATFHLSCCYFDIASSRPIKTTPIRSLFLSKRKIFKTNSKLILCGE